MNFVPRNDQLVHLYLDINPVTKKIFYVGIGASSRLCQYKRNRYHQKIVESILDKKYIRKVIYRNIPIEKAWRIEKQIIKKCGRLVYKNGYLANIHEGGPLPMEDKNYVHWSKGNKIKNLLPDYISPRLGKTFEEMFGEEKAKYLKLNQSIKMKGKISRRIKEKGKTQKEIERDIKNAERRRNKQYTEKELESFKKQSELQQGKSMRERLNNPNWVNPHKGKTAKEIYGENYKGPPNKGKTYKELKGQDYIDPRAKTFTIQIDDEQPIFCESERDFCEIFNANDVLLGKIKKSKNNYYKIKRQLNSNHYFSDGSLITLKYCDPQSKLEISIVNDIINKQKNKIKDWIITKNNKPTTKKYLNYKYKYPFTITINDEEPIYCKSETDCCEKFKCDRTIIGVIKKSPEMTYHFKKRSANSKHIFPNNSIVKFNYIK
jgi:hypothetical protein